MTAAAYRSSEQHPVVQVDAHRPLERSQQRRGAPRQPITSAAVRLTRAMPPGGEPGQSCAICLSSHSRPRRSGAGASIADQSREIPAGEGKRRQEREA